MSRSIATCRLSSPRPSARGSRFEKGRILDLVAAAMGLALTAPLMALIAVTIWCSIGRPIFFSQLRVGQRGRPFPLHKFRKFQEKRSAAGGCPVTLDNDPRLTRFGRFLAATKLDELPQLWNVVRGEMSIVGPRPESLELADCFAGDCGKVLEFAPGIFGPSQVFLRNEGSIYPKTCNPEQFYREVLFPLKARIDLAYFSHRTVWTDLGWIFRGVFAVLGWSSLPFQAQDLTKCAEQRLEWLRQRYAGERAPDIITAQICSSPSATGGQAPDVLPVASARFPSSGGGRHARVTVSTSESGQGVMP